jgi:alkaline phosphatase
MTIKAIDLLDGRQGNRQGRDDRGYFLMVEGGRIDHAHHEGNAIRALNDARELDRAIAAAVRAVDLRDTLIIVSADHSHVFNITGYPLRPLKELPYPVASYPAGFDAPAGNGILDVVYDVNAATGAVEAAVDRNGVPYTALAYVNGPGYRGNARVDPRTDVFPGRNGAVPTGPSHQAYFQESAVPLGSETHAGEEVAIYAIGAGADLVRGTVKNTFIYQVMAKALGISPR